MSIKQTYIVYLDEFGHIGPYIARSDPKYNCSPVFGLGGIIMPADQVRIFSTWFYQLKCRLLDFELKNCGEPPYRWEKKGTSLYTTKNVLKYIELRKATFRLFNKINSCGGNIFYTGIEKTAEKKDHHPNPMMYAVLREVIKRLDQHCIQNDSVFLIFLDHHDDAVLKDALITIPQYEMYGPTPRRTLLETPTQVESHRYQLMQAADWICGLIGRIEAYRTCPDEYADYSWTEKYFTNRLQQIRVRSGVRKQSNLIKGLPDDSLGSALNTIKILN